MNRAEHSSFAKYVKERIHDFHKGAYSSDVRSDKYYKQLESYYANMGKLHEFARYFEYIRCLRKIYDHPFVQKIADLARSLGARPFAWLGEYNEELDWWEADQIVRGRRKFNDYGFISAGFIKEKVEPWGSIGSVACVILLRTFEDKQGNIVAEAADWGIIQTGIGQIRATFS